MFVSIVIPCTDRVEGLSRTIKSVLTQDCEFSIELLLIENNSRDKRIIGDLISCFNDVRIKHFYLKDCNNANMARNYGAKNAIGNIIAFCDSDDYWKSNHLERKVALLNDKSFAIYSGNYVDRGNRIKNKPSRAINNDNPIEFLFGDNRGYAQTSSFVIKKEVFERVKWDETLKRNQDYDFFIRVQKEFGWAFDEINTTTVYWPRNVVRSLHIPSFDIFINKFKSDFNEKLYANYYFDRLMDSCMIDGNEFHILQKRISVYSVNLSSLKRFVSKSKFLMKLVWLINQNLK